VLHLHGDPKKGGVRIGDNYYTGGEETEHLAYLIKGALCPRAVIDFVGCGAAKGNFMRTLGSLTRARVRGATAKVEGITYYDGQGNVTGYGWGNQEGWYEEFIPNNFPEANEAGDIDDSQLGSSHKIYPGRQVGDSEDVREGGHIWDK